MNEVARIKNTFQEKQKRNPKYSLRSYAKDLGVSVALLSLVFAGKKPPSANLILKFQRKFGNGVLPAPQPAPRPARSRTSAPFLHQEAVPELDQWQEIALLDLISLSSFQADVSWIAQRLQLSTSTVLESLEKLSRLGLIETSENSIRKKNRKISVGTTRSLRSIRKIHRGFIQKALEELNRDDESAFSKRRISGTTMAINPKRLDEAKQRIDEFQQEMAEFLTQGKCSELYQINIQLFPLLK